MMSMASVPASNAQAQGTSQEVRFKKIFIFYLRKFIFLFYPIKNLNFIHNTKGR